MQSQQRLDPRVRITEDIDDGVAPAFQAEGFVRPGKVPLITDGALVGSLVSPRTAREFDLQANGANGGESPEALAMDGGSLPARDALAALDTGLAVGNLWYLNYSDRPACRMTGMTRFATFWVEGGKVVAPVNVLRFDDTLYRMLGDNLEALTTERELLLDANSYGSRMLTSSTCPARCCRRCSSRFRKSGQSSGRRAVPSRLRKTCRSKVSWERWSRDRNFRPNTRQSFARAPCCARCQPLGMDASSRCVYGILGCL